MRRRKKKQPKNIMLLFVKQALCEKQTTEKKIMYS